MDPKTGGPAWPEVSDDEALMAGEAYSFGVGFSTIWAVSRLDGRIARIPEVIAVYNLLRDMTRTVASERQVALIPVARAAVTALHAMIAAEGIDLNAAATVLKKIHDKKKL